MKLTTLFILGGFAAFTASVHAAFSIGGTTFDGIVAPDDSLGGNTINVTSPGTAYTSSTLNNTDGFWYDCEAINRTGESYLGTTLLTTTLGLGASDGFEGSSQANENLPGLRTTVSGLDVGTYDVYIAYVSRPTGGRSSAGIGATLTGGAMTYFDGSDTGAVEEAGISPWALALSPLGTTAAGVTSFSADIDQNPASGRVVYVGLAYVAVPDPTEFNGGDMLATGDWTDGLPVAPVKGISENSGTFNDGNAGVADWLLTMTDGTITVGQDWHFTGASEITIDGGSLDVAGNIQTSADSAMTLNGGSHDVVGNILSGDDSSMTLAGGTLAVAEDIQSAGYSTMTLDGGTINVTGDILASGNSTMTFNGGTVTWGGFFGPEGDPAGTLTINDGTFTGTASAATTFGNAPGGNLTVAGGSITASTYDFDYNAYITDIGGSAVLSGDSATFGYLNLLTNWSGSFTVTDYSGSDWEEQFTLGNITSGGSTIDDVSFALNFTVTNGGQTLTYTPSTDFLGGDINNSADWSNNFPGGLTIGTIAVDGSNSGTVFNFGAGSVVNQTAGTITSADGFNLTNGTWNMSGGKIIPRYLLSNGGNTLINLSGGTIELADVEGGQHAGVTNGGKMNVSGSAVIDGTQATLGVQIGGTLNILSDWTGSWTWGPYSGSDWESLFLAGSITLDGNVLDLAGFDANFAVTDDGQTLARGSGGTPDSSEPALAAIGFDGGNFMIDAINLDPAKTYTLTRGTDLTAFPDSVGDPVTGVSTFQFSDDSAPPGRAFYRLEEN